MGRSSRVVLVLAAAAAALPLPVRAGEPEEAREMRLTLREAVALALRNNLDLRASSYGPPAAGAALDEAEAIYDHLFTARVNSSASTQADPFSSAILAYKTDGTPIPRSEPAVREERALEGGAGVSRLLPTGGNLSLDLSTDRTFTNVPGLLLSRRYDPSVGLFLRQPLLRGAGRAYTEAGIEFARDAKDFADLEFRSRTENLVRQVEVTYWALVNARGQLTVQEKSLEVARDLLAIAEARLAAGAGTKVDVSQAGAGVAIREVDRLRAGNDVRSTEEILLGLVLPDSPGAGKIRIVPVDDPSADLPPVPEEEVDAAVETALLRRSEVRQLLSQIHQTEVSVQRAASDTKARLDLAAGVTYTGLDSRFGESVNDSLASREFHSWNAGLVLEIPIGNRAAKARLRRAELLRSQKEAELRALQNAIAIRVRNARRDLESARDQIQAARRAQSLAEEQLDAERERLRADKSTTFEVLRLEDDLTRASTSLLRSLADYRGALARYDFEVGRILEARGLAPPALPE